MSENASRSSCSCSGFSRIEVVCIAAIAAVCVALALAVAAGMLGDMQAGDDSITVNTAQSCGNASAAAACPVPDCPGVDTPQHEFHIDSNGNLFAYFDKVGNCLTAQRSAGYNEGAVRDSEGKSYAPGSAVVRVTIVDGTAQCDWVLGS